MYYCNKCGQEMVDSGHRCAVQSERLTSVVRSNATNGWISVKDRLPENNNSVLTYSDDIDGNKYRLITPNLSLQSFPSSVTHWMPLPEPPK